jgi:hypothetical protein
MVRRRKQKKNKGGADWTAKGTPSGASTASLVKEDETMGNVIRKSKEVFGRGKDLLVDAIFNNPEQSPGIGGRRKRQKGGGEKEDLIGKPVGEEECQKNVRMPQKGGNKNKYEGCGGDVFKGLYGGGKRKSRRSTKMRRSRRTRKKRGRGTQPKPKTCPTGESWDAIEKKCSRIDVALHVDPVGPNDNRIRTWSASSVVGGKRRKRRRTKRRKSKGRRRKSRRRKRHRSRNRRR